MLNFTLKKSAYEKAEMVLGLFGTIERVDPDTGDTDISIDKSDNFKFTVFPNKKNIWLVFNGKICELKITDVTFFMYH